MPDASGYPLDSHSFLRRFRIQIVIRLLLLAMTIVAGCYFLFVSKQYLLVSLTGIVLLIQASILIRTIERITRDLVSFLEAIEYSDFTQSFSPPYSDAGFHRLYGAFSNVMHAFQETRAKSEAQRMYLETLVHHINTGLICFHPAGDITLMNNAAKRLLERPTARRVQDLSNLGDGFVATLLNLSAGEQRLEQVNTGTEVLQLAINATRFTLQGDEYVLASIQNIGTELEDKELDAMQHMTRVLAHEIMNSITPIASLAASARDHLRQEPPTDNDPGGDSFSRDDLQAAMETIEKRSQGLLHFVSAYRSIARIPRPNFRLIEVKNLLNGTINLMETQLKGSSISVSVEVEPTTLSVLADPDLIEQVLINLIKNATESVEAQPDGKISLSGGLDRRGRVVLQITDNGPGIPPEVLDQIFIPFFSTKTQGSGIGLSFSRQVMRRHKGSLRVQSEAGGPTTFSLRF